MKLDNSNISFSQYDIKRGIRLPTKLSEDLAYFTGILAGDGHLTGVKGKYEIHCSGNPHDEIEFYDQNMRMLVFRLFNIKINTKHIGGGTYGFRIGSRCVHSFLSNTVGLPTGKKYKKLKIPEKFKHNNNLKDAFIKGLADTDFGFVLKKRYKKISYYPVISFNSKSKSFLKEVYVRLKEKELKLSKIFKVIIMDDRTRLGYTITYRFEINGHKELIKWINTFDFRHPKFIRKTNLWKLRNPKFQKEKS